MRVLKSTTLFLAQKNRVEVCNIQMVSHPSDAGGGVFEVRVHIGPQGGPLRLSQTSDNRRVSLTQSIEIFDGLCADKIALGYRLGDGSQTGSQAGLQAGLQEVELPATGRLSSAPIMPQMPNPVNDDSQLESLIEDPQWLMQEKIDGQRRLIFVGEGMALAYNENGVDVILPAKTFAALAQKPAGLLLDGELVGEHYYVFDAVADAQGKLTSGPLADRLEFMDSLDLFPVARLSTQSPVGDVMRVVTAASRQEKRQLLADVKQAGGEGVVFKRRDSLYMPGRQGEAGKWLAYNLYETAVVIVFGRPMQGRTVRIAVWRDSSGMDMEDVGRITIPPNILLPESGDCVEVRYPDADPCGALRQPQFVRLRRDVRAANTWDSLKFRELPNDGFLGW